MENSEFERVSSKIIVTIYYLLRILYILSVLFMNIHYTARIKYFKK